MRIENARYEVYWAFWMFIELVHGLSMHPEKIGYCSIGKSGVTL